MGQVCGVWVLMHLSIFQAGFGKPRLETRPKAAARLDLKVSAWWVSLSSRGLWGGDALLLSTDLSAEPKP
jgi:hypothetical protein